MGPVGGILYIHAIQQSHQRSCVGGECVGVGLGAVCVKGGTPHAQLATRLRTQVERERQHRRDAIFVKLATCLLQDHTQCGGRKRVNAAQDRAPAQGGCR
jgi:hypothetical protein